MTRRREAWTRLAPRHPCERTRVAVDGEHAHVTDGKEEEREADERAWGSSSGTSGWIARHQAMRGKVVWKKCTHAQLASGTWKLVRAGFM